MYTYARARVLCVCVLKLNNSALQVDPRRYSIYREEAIDSIRLALDLCLSDEKFVPNSRRGLLMLGGHFSSSGEILIESWLLKQAGFCDDSGLDSVFYDIKVDDTISEVSL